MSYRKGKGNNANPTLTCVSQVYKKAMQSLLGYQKNNNFPVLRYFE